MALRDIPYSEYEILFLLGGLSARTIEALPGAFERTTRSLITATRRLANRSTSANGIEAVHVEPVVTDARELLASVLARGVPKDGVALTIAGDHVVVALAHRCFDGATALTFVHDLMDRACGIEPEPDVRQIARWPVMSALRTARIGAVVEFARRRIGGRVRGTVAVASADARPELAVFRLGPEVLGRVKRSRGPWIGQGRATLNTKLCTAVLHSLAAAQRSPGDLRVRIPADLRHLVPGRQVRGNFVCGDAIGTLHGDEWAAPELNRRLTTASGASGAISLATAYPRHLAARAVHRRRRPAPAVNVSLVGSSRRFPATAWAGEDRRLACVSAGAPPSPVFVFVWTVDGSAHVTVYDETGLFDLEDFEARLTRQLDATYAPA